MPAYNVAPTLAATVSRIPWELWDNILTCWIVNDGSRDDTGRVAEALAVLNPKVRSIHFERNRGYGAVVKEGLARCRAEGCTIAVCLHGDGQYPPESVGPLAEVMRARHLDMLQASRHAAGTARADGMPRYKLIAGRAVSWVENRALGLNLTDYRSGFLLYSQRALDRLPFSRLSAGVDIHVELIACARALDLRIEERPLPPQGAGEGPSLRPIPDGLRSLRVAGRFVTGHYHRLCRG